MGYPVRLALRYLGSKKRASISVGTMFAILGVALGVAALLTVMSVTGGFQAEFREKVLGVNAHVILMKSDFADYREVMERVREVPGVVNIAPFSINPMMISNGDKTETGVLVKGVDPKASLGVDLGGSVPPVLDLPRHIVRGEVRECPRPSTLACGIENLHNLRKEGAVPNVKGPTPTLDDHGNPIKPNELKAAAPDPVGSASSSAGEPPVPEPPIPDPTIPEEKPAPSPIPSASASAPKLGKARPGAVQPMRPPPAASATASATASAETAIPAAPPASSASAATGSASAPASSAPPIEGEITPKGGYTSKLPDDDDEVFKELVKDPCDDPELVKTLPGIVVGVSLAETLDLKLGSCVTVSSPTIGFQFVGGVIKAPVAKKFRVMAMFEAGFEQYDSKLVYTDLYEAQAFYDEGDTVTGLEMKIGDIDRSDDVVDHLKESLGCSDGACPYRIMDWKELNHGLFTALLIQQIGMSGVLALIILVAAFTVVATLIMVVLDKKKEISVLKAMGATDSAILRVFLYQGGLIGGVGTALGLLIGFAVCKGLLVWAFPLDPKVYFISKLPVLMRWQEFTITGAVAVSLCLLATIIPSWYAANIRPAEGFRDQ